jgi:hypothetical protein
MAPKSCVGIISHPDSIEEPPGQSDMRCEICEVEGDHAIFLVFEKKNILDTCEP